MSAHVMTTSDRNAAIQASWGASVSFFKSLENEVSKVPAAQGNEGCQGMQARSGPARGGTSSRI